MLFQLKTTELEFKRPFVLSHGVRTGTNALFLKMEALNTSGFAEATFPPYIHISISDTLLQVETFLQQQSTFVFTNVHNLVACVEAGNLNAYARCLVLNALLDLNARLQKITLRNFIGMHETKSTSYTTLTVTKSDTVYLVEKLNEANEFTHIKLKLNGTDDLTFVEMVAENWNKPFCVDVNQGWENLTNKDVLHLVSALQVMGCTLVEQPFNAVNYERHLWLKQKNILPVFADEGIQDENQLMAHGNCFNGINIKLLKCGGLDKAISLAQQATAMELSCIAGCMSESSCGCALTFALQPLVAYLDIDGPQLIRNDPFTGLAIKNGIFETSFPYGSGVMPKNAFF